MLLPPANEESGQRRDDAEETRASTDWQVPAPLTAPLALIRRSGRGCDRIANYGHRPYRCSVVRRLSNGQNSTERYVSAY